MAKTKQKTPSAAQRREKERQQRQQRLAGSQNNRTPAAQAQARSRGPMQRKSSQRQWLWIGGIVALIAVIIVAFVVISRVQSSPSTSATPTPASSQVFKQVTQVDPNVLAAVGTGGVTNPLKAVNGSPPVLTGSTGKPEFLYMGAEYCPYCAAERWSVVVALSRFGTFSKLYQTTSSSTDVYPSTPTFTFYPGHYGGSFYTSSYIDFVPVETEDQQQNPLQTPTTAQQNLSNTYDAPPYTTSSNAGGIPFIDIGNRYVLSGASYDPAVLRSNPQNPSSQPLSQQEIANNLVDSNSTVSKDILGSANYLTAAICTMTHQQPGSVCNTPGIQTIEHTLGKAIGPGGPQMAVSGHFEAVVRRQD
jgi:thiol-disulfide isomerase/thioredoxin